MQFTNLGIREEALDLVSQLANHTSTLSLDSVAIWTTSTKSLSHLIQGGVLSDRDGGTSSRRRLSALSATSRVSRVLQAIRQINNAITGTMAPGEDAIDVKSYSLSTSNLVASRNSLSQNGGLVVSLAKVSA